MKALLVVDYQNDYVIGPLGSKYAGMIENNICARIEETLGNRNDLYFLVDAFGPDYLDTPEGKKNPVKHCIWGTSGAEVYGKAQAYITKGHVLKKQSPAAHDLVDRLKKYDEIEVCGLETHKDVLANAILARTMNPRARVVIRQNCIASRDSMLAEEATDIMNSLGIDVL